MLKLKALATVGFLITKGFLFRGEGLTDLQVDFDCPFLIFHTFIMNASGGTLKPKVIDASIDHLKGFLLGDPFPPYIIQIDDVR
jgi:hypothetical protein